MKNLKGKKGITLVALVITIIILLILAGVSIASLTGNGLFENARLAKQRAKEAEDREKGILSGYEDIINGYLSGTTRDDGISEELVKEIQKIKTDLEDAKTELATTKTSLETTQAALQKNATETNTLKTKVTTLESQLASNGKRVQLMNTPIQLTQANQEIDLNDAISNYDYLEIELESNFSSGTKPDMFQSIFINTDILNSNYNRGVMCDIYDNYFIAINKKDNNTLYIPNKGIAIGDVSSVFINKVIGIKL